MCVCVCVHVCVCVFSILFGGNQKDFQVVFGNGIFGNTVITFIDKLFIEVHRGKYIRVVRYIDFAINRVIFESIFGF